MTERPPGRVITFYSYKGGTGRSMALANVAWILAANGKRVLVVDWDLEAPGLHRYFAPFLVDHELATTDGVIDFLGAYADAVLTPPRTDEERRPDWYLAYADITRLATSIDWKFDRGGSLDFIGAGRQGSAYAGHVANFPWQAFFDRLGGGTLLEAARERMRATYDYVLLDSRTGVSDAAGICTIQMPDALVVCFTLNNQSIAGAANIARTVSAKPGKGDMPIFPVPMRVEEGQTDKLDVRRKYARSSFAQFPSQLDAPARDAYWGRIEVRYHSYYAYEEVLAVFGDAPGQVTSLLASMERLTGHVSRNEVTEFPPMPEHVRLLNRDMYAWQSDRAIGRRDSIREAERLLALFGRDEQEESRRLLTRLVRVGRVEEGGANARARVARSDLQGSESVLGAFATAGVITLESDPALKEEFVELADDGLVQRWPTLRQWIEEDREFLLWRQQLRIYCADWDRTGRDKGALLSGVPLAEALEYLARSPERLSNREREYIDASQHEDAMRVEHESERDRLKEKLKESEVLLHEVRANEQVHRVRAGRRAAVLGLLVVGLIAVGFWLHARSDAQRDVQTVFNARAPILASLTASAALAASTGDDSTALARYDSSIHLDSTFVAAYVGRGAYYASHNQYQLAAADFSRAIRFDSSADDAYLRRGMALRQLGYENAALADLDRTIARQPTNAQALFERGLVYEATSQKPKAIADFGAAIKADSGLTAAYLRRGVLYSSLKNNVQARADLSRALELSKEGDSLHAAAKARLSALPAPVVQAGGALPSPRMPVSSISQRITLQYEDSLDAKDVFDLYLTLRRRRGWLVDAPERAASGGANEAIPDEAVRYFSDDDKSFALEVWKMVQGELHGRGWPLDMRMVRMNGSYKARPGLVEVWIASSHRAKRRGKAK